MGYMAMKLAFALSLLVSAVVVADEPLSFVPLEASLEDCDRLANSHAWKWRCQTAEPQKLLLLNYYHFIRDSAGKLQKKPTRGHSICGEANSGTQHLFVDACKSDLLTVQW
jgi:hypothetical protein